METIKNMGNENKIFKKHATYIFSFYKHCTAPGQGLYLYRTLEATARKEGKTQSEIKNYHLVIFNLFENGYFDMPKGVMPFVKLTEKGFEYTQGDSLIANSIQLANYIDLTENDINVVFRQLWDVIGKQDEAPFYVSGSTFFDTIYPYVNSLSSSYSVFMKELKEKGVSTSRVTWYKELLMKVDRANITNFLHDLSIAIGEFYEEDQGNENFDWNESLEIPTVLQEKKEEISLKSENIKAIKMKRKVFITYCWEDDIHTAWVHNLSEKLQNAGFDVIIDVKQPLGIELNKFMEQTIINADKVLIIATPEYKERADNRKHGVGYETSLITADLIKDQNRIKFIPIIRKGSKDDCYPTYLGNRKGLPMTEKDDYTKALKELIDNIENY